MKALKVIGIILTVAAFFAAIGTVGKSDFEQEQRRAGEITREEMTSTDDLIRQFAGIGGVAAIGGIMWAIGAHGEAAQEEKRRRGIYR